MANKKLVNKKSRTNSKNTPSKRGRSATKKNASAKKNTPAKKTSAKKNTPAKKTSTTKRGRSTTNKNVAKSANKHKSLLVLKKPSVAKNLKNYPAVFEKDGSFFRVSVCAKRSVDGIVLPPKCITKTFYKKLTNKDSSHLPTLPVHMRPQLPIFPLMGM